MPRELLFVMSLSCQVVKQKTGQCDSDSCCFVVDEHSRVGPIARQGRGVIVFVPFGKVLTLDVKTWFLQDEGWFLQDEGFINRTPTDAHVPQRDTDQA